MLDARLPRLLKGEEQPADTAERLALASLCQLPCKQLYAASARWYSEAFAAEPGHADDLSSGYRYNAACAAAQAGCRQGKDTAGIAAKEGARLRQQAVAWLRADLTAWGKTLEKDADKARPAVQMQMQHWQQDTDFAGVRGPDALAKLPDAERQQWEKLWEDVALLKERATASKSELVPPPKGEKK